MLCLSDFELYSRWVPLIYFAKLQKIWVLLRGVLLFSLPLIK